MSLTRPSVGSGEMQEAISVSKPNPAREHLRNDRSPRVKFHCIPAILTFEWWRRIAHFTCPAELHTAGPSQMLFEQWGGLRLALIPRVNNMGKRESKRSSRMHHTIASSPYRLLLTGRVSASSRVISTCCYHNYPNYSLYQSQTN